MCRRNVDMDTDVVKVEDSSRQANGLIARNWMSAGWKIQGVQEASRKYRLERRREGDSVEESWVAAAERWPLTAETVTRLKEISAEHHVGHRVRREREEVALKKKVAGKVEARTGIEQFDWAYANLGFSVPLSPAPAAGDDEFLNWAKENRDEFYKKFYLPALMKKVGVGVGAAAVVEAVADPSEQTVDSLLKTLQEAKG